MQPNTIYMIPPNRTMVIDDARDAQTRECRRSPIQHRSECQQVYPGRRRVTDAPLSDERPVMPVAAAHSTARKVRVLVIDDNKDVRESTCELLTMGASRFGPATILLDVGIPDLSGCDVARKLRQMPQLANTLLIAFTGYDTPEAREMSSAAGFDHHIAKPVNFDELALILH
jgi:CheY-like chemotaxis protein